MTPFVIYLCGAVGMAAFIGLAGDIEDGGWPKVTAVVLISALWPVTVAMGVGNAVRGFLRVVCRFALKVRAASGILTEGGDAKQAPGDSLSSPIGDSRDAQEQSHD